MHEVVAYIRKSFEISKEVKENNVTKNKLVYERKIKNIKQNLEEQNLLSSRN